MRTGTRRNQTLQTGRSIRIMAGMRSQLVRQMSLIAALTMCGGLQAATPAAHSPVSLAPQDTNLIARLDLADVQGSPLITMLRGDYRRELGVIDTFMGLFVGFVPQDVARVWLYATEPRQGVLLLEGRFAAEEIATKLSRFDALETLQVAGVRHVSRMVEAHDGKVNVIAVLSDRLLALGEEQAMGRLLAAWRGELDTLPSDDPSLQRVAQAKGHLAAILRDPATWPEFDAQAAKLIDQTWLQARVTEDLTIELDLHTVDDLAAEALENIVRGWLLIEQRDPQLRARPVLLKGLQSAQLTRRERMLRLSLQLPGTALARELEASMGRRDKIRAIPTPAAPIAP